MQSAIQLSCSNRGGMATHIPSKNFEQCCAAFREERLWRGTLYLATVPVGSLTGAGFRFGSSHNARTTSTSTSASEAPIGVVQRNRCLWYKDKAYVDPATQTRLIKEIYESRLGGHMGIAKTAARIKQHYDFPGLRKKVEEVLGRGKQVPLR